MTGLGRFARGKPSSGEEKTTAPSVDPQATTENQSNDTEDSWVFGNVNDTDDHTGDDGYDMSFLDAYGAFDDNPHEGVTGNNTELPSTPKDSCPTAGIGGGLLMIKKRLPADQIKAPSSTKDHSSSAVSAQGAGQNAGGTTAAPRNQASTAGTHTATVRGNARGSSGKSPASNDTRSVHRVARNSMVGEMTDPTPVHEGASSFGDRSARGQHDSSSMAGSIHEDMSQMDEDTGFVTANESTRIIPGPPTTGTGTRPRGVSISTTGGPSAVTAGSGRDVAVTPQAQRGSIMAPPNRSADASFPTISSASERSTGGAAGTAGTGVVSCVPHSLATGGHYSNSASAAFRTPRARSRSIGGDTSFAKPANRVATITPSHDSSSLSERAFHGSLNHESSPSSQVVSKIATTTPKQPPSMASRVTPLQHETGGDDSGLGQRQIEGSSIQEEDVALSGEDDSSSSSLSFEELHELFRSQLQELDDNQGTNAITLLKLQDMFTTAHAESLQDHASLLDLLASAEKACIQSDAVIAKYQISA